MPDNGHVGTLLDQWMAIDSEELLRQIETRLAKLDEERTKLKAVRARLMPAITQGLSVKPQQGSLVSRLVKLMRDGEKRTCREIAEKLGEIVTTVSPTLRRAGCVRCGDSRWVLPSSEPVKAREKRSTRSKP